MKEESNKSGISAVSLAEMFRDLVFIVNHACMVTECSRQVLDVTGYKPREIIGKSFTGLFPGYQHKDLEKWLGLDPRKGIPPIYLKLSKADGSPLYLHCSLGTPARGNNTYRIIRGIQVTEGVFPEMEKSLAEEMFFKAFHSNPALMAISRFEDSQYMDVNESFLRNLGYQREEIIGHTSTELQLFVDLIQSDKFLKKLKKLSKVRDFDVTIQTKSGERRYGLFSAEVIMLQGEPCLLTIINDITERRKAEQNLEITELRYRQVLENMIDCLVVYRPLKEGADFTILEFNEAAEKVENISRKQAIGRKLSEVFPVAVTSGFTNTLKKVSKNGQSEHTVISFRDGQGKQVWRDNYVYQLQTGEVVAIYQDITQEKEAEEKLRLSEQRFRELAEMLPLMICETDPEGTITFANLYVYQHTRFSPEDIAKGLKTYDLFSEKDRSQAQKFAGSVLKGTSGDKPAEYVVVRKDGSSFPAMVYLNPIFRKTENMGFRWVLIDISEREQAKQQLELEKAYLGELIGSAPEAIVLADMEGRIMQVNAEFTRLFGYTTKEAVGKDLDQLLAEGKYLKQANRISQTVNKGKRVEIETKRRKRDGSLVDVSILGTPIVVNNQKVGVYGIYRDISERKKNEMVQHMITTISKAVITTKNLNDLFFVIKGELSKIMDTTNFFVALYNKEKDTVSLPFFRDEKDKFRDIPAGKTITSHVIRTGSPVLLSESDMKKLEEEGEIELVGSSCRVWMGVPLRSKKEITGVISLQHYHDPEAYTQEDLNILGFIADQIGIAIEWKRAETELFNSLEKYRAVAETTIAGIGISDLEDNLTYVNAAFADMLGYEPAELTGKNLADLTTPDKYQYIRDQTSKRMAGVESQYETTLVRKNGTYLETLIHASPLFDEENIFRETLSVIIDITRLKEVQEELIRAKEMAEEAARAKQQFLSTMSHEIRTPMNAVIGMAHLLLQEKPRPDQMENLQTLKFSAENLLVLINDILDYSKIEAGKVVFEETDFNLKQLLSGIRQSFLFKATDNNIELKCDIAADVPDIVIGDPARLNQVLTNLLSNAIKFTEKGGVYLEVSVAGRTDTHTALSFSVRDTGIGIPEDQMDSIFTSFAQASTDTTRKYGGTGLGLAICRQLLALKDSQLNVESTEGEGSRFFFTLNMKNSSVTEISRGDSLGAISYEKFRGKKVLLVEDNEMNLIVAIKFLKKWGLVVKEARNGNEALDILKDSDFDLVLMDLQMPGMDGYEATRQIRSGPEKYKHIPVIALTASIMNDVQEQIYRSGMNDMILKPFNPGELYSRIARYLDQ